MKRRLSISLAGLLMMLVFIFVLPNTAQAATVDSGTCGENLTWTLDDEGTLTVSGTGDMRWEGGWFSGPSWEDYMESIKCVVIEEGVTSIYENAFRDHTNIKTIVFPKTIISVWDGAFDRCRNIANFYVPDLATWLYLTDGAAGDSPAGTSVTERKLYINGELITNLVIPEGTMHIGSAAFYGCSSLVSVSLPDSIANIGSYAFQNCTGLTSFVIPDSCESIDPWAFAGCSNLTDLTIGNGVTEISGYAFSGCSSLTEVTIPDSVTYMPGREFEYCTSLEKVVIGKGMEYISEAMFKQCTSLKSITIPDTVTELKYGAFYECTGLESVVLSDNLEYIGSMSFYGCTNLQSITIPASVTALEGCAFQDCTSLSRIYFQGDAPQFYGEEFKNVTADAYYPADNQTWTEEVKQDYGGKITWNPYCGDNHAFEVAVTEPTCTAKGYTTYTCTVCGYAYDGNYVDATGEHSFDNNVDGTCNDCGVNRETVEARQVHHMFRMYNPNTGEHFYTGSEEERDNLVGHGWQYEGVGFTFPKNTGAPVHRLFQPSTGEHLYTMDVAEKDRLLADGWNYEGIAFNSAYDTEAVQHRLHNPNAIVGAYHFTFSLEEKQHLIDAGWEYQGIGWYSCWK